MSYPTAVTPRPAPLPSPLGALLQAALALASGLSLFVLMLAALLVGYDLYYAGRIFPGVSVAGVEVAGLRPEQAAIKIAQALTYPQTGRLLFQEGEKLWVASPAELGLVLDPQASALLAYRMGRQRGIFTRLSEQFLAWYSGRDLPPLLIFDQRGAYAYLNRIALEIDRPTIEASLSVQGTEVVVLSGQVGRSVDIPATLAPLEAQLRSLTDGAIPVLVRESPPVILDASAQAEIARKILSQPLTLQVPEPQAGDPGPWQFDPATLAGMLVIERQEEPQGAQYRVALNAASLRSFLENNAPAFARLPEDARFIFNDETSQLEVIEPAVIGRALNVDATIQAINERVTAGEHSVGLVFDYTNPLVGDKVTAQELGITEAVSVQTSYFYGSSAERIQNIKTAASRFHGVFVPPGATFSMAEVMGDVSLDNGYAEALIIYGNRTIKGVGGGVCQVSTTLFRTVFFGGYPVMERHSHAYRVSYYELNRSGSVDTRMAGLDATVFVPVVDFRFTNDTPYWLLMETYVNAKARTLTWKFYSTSEGRTVDWDTTGLRNVVDAPEPLYQENPELAQGEIRQVDWEAAGADVTVYRTVYRNGQVYLEDQFSTHYQPWQAVYEYGPGTDIPNKKKRD